MGFYDYKTYEEQHTPSTMEKVLQHWIDIINERKSFEEFMNTRPTQTALTKSQYGHDLYEQIPITAAQESMFQSDFDADFEPYEKIYLGEMNSCMLSGRSPTSMVEKFRPMLKHIELNRGHWVTGFYDPKSGDPVAIVSVKTENDGHLWIKALEVHEKYRGHGLGRQVLQYACKTAQNIPVYLAVHPDNKVAIFMYTDEGFELDYRSQKEYQDGKRKNVVMIRR